MDTFIQTSNMANQLRKQRKLRVLVIGASGHVGSTVCGVLQDTHELIRVSRTSGDFQADITERASIERLFQQTGPVDAVVIAAGAVHFSKIEEFSEEDFLINLRHKVMGQINVVLVGIKYVNAAGSFTLSSGILDRDPVPMGSGAATANGALGGFVVGAAIDLPNSQRINAVSTGIQDISVERYGAVFPGHIPVTSKRVESAYIKCVEGAFTGKILTVD